MTPWHLGRMAAIDFESSGTDPLEAFIVSCCVALVGGGEDTQIREWILSPGDREIPEGAVAVHGISTERARAEGVDHAEGLDEIAAAVARILADGVPLVGHNIGSYDLPLLEAECLRESVAPIQTRSPVGFYPVIDTLVIDKHCLPYRSRVSETQGPYQLRTTAQTYGLEWSEEQAHGSTYDALMSARAAWHIGNIAHLPADQRPEFIRDRQARERKPELFDDVAGISLGELHDRQVKWAAEDAVSFQRWLRTKAPADRRDPNAVVDGTWPVRYAAGVAS
jgi:DNA polymerase-3 subunit epsilon